MKTILFALFVILFGFVRSQTKLTKTYDTICSQTNTSKIFLCLAINNDVEATFKWKKINNTFSLINEKDSLIVNYNNLNEGNNQFVCETTIGNEVKSDTFKLYVNPDTKPTFSIVEPLCIGSTLKALPKISTNGISGSWLPAFDNTKTTTYTFTPSFAHCATTTLTITIHPALVGNTSGKATSICTNTSTILTGGNVTGGSDTYSYLWESSSNDITWITAAGTSNASNYSTASLTANTYFRRTVISGGCTNVAASVLVTVNPVISGNTSGTATSICTNSSTILTGGTLTGGSGAYTYLWESSSNDITWITAAGTSNQGNYNTESLNANIYYRRTVTSGGCTDVASSVLVTVTPLIKGNTSGLDTSICLGSPLTLKGGALSAGDGNYIYKWESSTNKSTWFPAAGISNKADYTTNSLTESMYFRRTVISGPCTDVAKHIFLIVNLNPKVDLGTDKIICKGDSISLSTKIENDIDYLWNNNYNKNKIVVKDSGIYKLTVKNNKTSCTNSDSIHITVSDPKSKIVSSGPLSFCQGESIVLSVNADSKSSYQWSTNNSSIPGALSYQYQVFNSGLYKIQVTDSMKCIGVDSVTIKVNPLPNKPIIVGKSELCSSGLNQLYTTNPTSNKLIWDIKGADIYSGQSSNNLYINITSKDSVIIKLTELNKNTGCSSSNLFIVKISNKYVSPKNVQVIPMGGDNNFLAAPNVKDVIRWGSINKKTEEIRYYNSKNIYMDFSNIDTNSYLYFVDHGLSEECFTRSYYFYPEIVVGIENIDDFELNIFPNPGQSYLKIESNDTKNKEVIMENLEGKIVLKSNFNDKVNLDINELPVGMYIIKIQTNTKTIINKFSKI